MHGPHPQSTGGIGVGFAASVTLHLALVAGVLAIPTRDVPSKAKRERIDIVFARPSAPERPEPSPVTRRAEPPKVVEQRPEPPSERSRPEPSPPPRREVPPPPSTVARVERPAPRATERRIEPPAAPRPVPQVRTGSFATARTEPAPADRAPSAAPRATDFNAASKPTVSASSAPRVVASGLFGGSGLALPTVERRDLEREIEDVSFGGPTEPARTAGKEPPRGDVSAAGFDAREAAGDGDVPRSGAIVRGGFGDGAARTRPARERSRPAETLDTPVEVVSKPRPEYTDEARRLRIEGTVVLEVTFLATGDLRVLRVVEGLGHGLDEAAVEAARQVRFKPARRDGQPADHTATLRVVFRLA